VVVLLGQEMGGRKVGHAQAGLDLCQNRIEDYTCDKNVRDVMVYSRTRCHMELNEWKKATQFCTLGLQLIDNAADNNQYALLTCQLKGCEDVL
jgi:hypothetical protein